jgi:hypothetical protein
MLRKWRIAQQGAHHLQTSEIVITQYTSFRTAKVAGQGWWLKSERRSKRKNLGFGLAGCYLERSTGTTLVAATRGTGSCRYLVIVMDQSEISYLR